MNGLYFHGKKTFMDMKTVITNFLSNKNNLTLLQCLLYGVLGYILKEHYSWGEFAIVFAILFGIQFITHIKAVSIGIMMHQIMQEDQHNIIKFIKNIKKNKDEDLPN